MSGELPELEQLLRDRYGAVRARIVDLQAAAVQGVDRAAAIDALAKAITEAQTVAHLTGMRRVLVAADKAAGTPVPVSGQTGALPSVTFDEAVTALVKREPRLATVVDGVPKYVQVQEIYREGGFSAARAADQSVVGRVQIELGRGLQQGIEMPELRRKVQEAARGMSDWTDAYTENVIRTNVGGAHDEGTQEQVRDPNVSRVIPAQRYDATMDGDVRPNHKAANGMVVPHDHPLRQRWAVPNGYQCRCNWAFVNRAQLRRLDLEAPDGSVIPYIPPAVANGSAKPDPGFG